MTSFKGAIARKSLEDWEDEAIEAIESTGHNPQLLAVTGLGCGVLVAGLSPVSLLGLVPFLWGMKSAIEVNNTRSRMEAAIESGAYAAVLPMDELREYAQQFGVEQTIAQIQWAKRAGVPLSEAAATLLARYQQKYRALPAPVAETEAPAVDMSSVADEIARQSVPIPELVTAGVRAYDTPTDSNPSPPTDIWWDSTPVVEAPAHPVTHLIGDRLRTSLIVSVGGGGKDILLSNALRSFIATHPSFKIVVMDCKDDPKETGYYADLPNVRLHRLNVAVSSDGQVAEWAERCVDEFIRLPEKALLICNEGTLIRAKSIRYVQVIDGLVSSGDSREKYAWEAGQSAHISALRVNGDSRSRFRLLIIGLKGEDMQVDAILKAQCVADSARNMADFKSQMGRSPVNRAWSDGQVWHPMPELENYSGYDRDTRSFLGKNAAEKSATAEAKEALEKTFHTPEIFPSSDGNFPSPGNFSEGSGNRETERERGFSASGDDGKNFPEIEFPLLKAVYLAIKAEMENGKTKSEIVTGTLECKGRKYKDGCVWFDALLQKFEPK